LQGRVYYRRIDFEKLAFNERARVTVAAVVWFRKTAKIEPVAAGDAVSQVAETSGEKNNK
jgi:hypothetical protein